MHVSQIYVRVPGNPQPQLMTLDETVAKILAGALSDTADVVRVGEAAWIQAKDLPELEEPLHAEPPATSASTPRLRASQPATLLDSQAAQSPKTVLGDGVRSIARRIPKGARLGGTAGLGPLVLGGSRSRCIATRTPTDSCSTTSPTTADSGSTSTSIRSIGWAAASRARSSRPRPRIRPPST